MASSTPLSVARPEHRGLSFWMDRVLKELDKFRTAADADTVHDLRVAIRRCRSIASVMEEVDPDHAWPALRKSAKKLFQGLGELRDAQVMKDWVQKLAPEADAVRVQLHSQFAEKESELRYSAQRAAEKFNEKEWKHLARRLRARQRLVPSGGLAAECLALERLEEVKELHAKALRSEKTDPWHELRIGLKKFRYTVEGFLPQHYETWGGDLKRVQDLLGDLHDLDVLNDSVKKSDALDTEESRKFWQETIAHERHARIETYRQLTLGKFSLLTQWRANLPTNGRLAEASLARLRSTARAVDRHTGRTSQISRVGLAIFDALRHTGVFPALDLASTRRVFLAAARLHNVAPEKSGKSPQKAARKFVRSLPMPPGWNPEEWNILLATIRYHRGAEPRAKSKGFANFSEREQNEVRCLAGVLRLARALRKCGVTVSSGFRVEKSSEAIVLHTPYLPDTPETAAQVAAAKHLLESVLPLPLLLKPQSAKAADDSPRSAAKPSVETVAAAPLRFSVAAG